MTFLLFPQLSVQTTKLEEVKYSLSMEQANCSQLNSQLLQKCQEIDVCQQNLHSAAHRLTQLEASLQEVTNAKNKMENEGENLRKLLEDKVMSSSCFAFYANMSNFILVLNSEL